MMPLNVVEVNSMLAFWLSAIKPDFKLYEPSLASVFTTDQPALAPALCTQPAGKTLPGGHAPAVASVNVTEEGCAILVPVGPIAFDNATEKLRSAEELVASVVILTVLVVVSFADHVRVPDALLKSVPAIAVPLTVA